MQESIFLSIGKAGKNFKVNDVPYTYYFLVIIHFCIKTIID